MAHNRVLVTIAPHTYIALAFCIVMLPLKWLIAWLLAVIIHELGHIVACLLCKGTIQSVLITANGARIEADGLTYGKQLIATVAGPAAGLSMLFVCRWLPLTAAFSLIHSVYNLLPLMGSDGSNMLRCSLYLFHREGRILTACRIADLVSRVLLCSLGIYLSLKLGWMLGIVICVFVLICAKRNSCKESALQVQ